MIAIIDYGAGNIRSIEKALEYVGAQVQVTGDPAVVATAHAIVLPGVGSGGAAMARMTERGLDEAIRQATQQGKLPLLASPSSGGTRGGFVGSAYWTWMLI